LTQPLTLRYRRKERRVEGSVTINDGTVTTPTELWVPKPQLIYVAGPYTADTEAGMVANVEAMMEVGTQLIELGHAPSIPTLNHWHDLYIERTRGERFSWQVWMDCVNMIIPRCDAFFYTRPSKGTDIELQIAKASGLTIYVSMEEVPRVRGRQVGWYPGRSA
jgi:hypothetical protein